MSKRDTVIVTGATSFLGSATVRMLLEAGHTVMAVIRPGSAHINRLPQGVPGLSIIPAPLFGSAIIKSMIPHCDLWFHFGWGATDPSKRNDASEQHQNVYFSIQALETAAGMGARRFVFAGSQAEYGIYSSPVAETARCHPVSEYGKAKLNFGTLGAAAAPSLGIGFTHLRIFSVYGIGDHAHTMLPACTKAFLKGDSYSLSDCTQIWNYLNIHDFTALMRKISESKDDSANGIFNVASLDTRPLKDFVLELQQLCGQGTPLFGGPASKPEGPVQLIPDISKASSVFSWIPEVTFADGIRELIHDIQKRESYYEENQHPYTLL